MTDSITSTPHDQDETHKLFLRFFNKALILQANNQYEQAIDYYEKAASLKPDHLPTRQVMGFLYQSLQRFPEALEQYKQAIKLHENSATLQNSAGLCEERCKNLPAAKQHYLNAIHLKHNNSEALNNLGNVCRKLGEYELAEEYLLSALRLKICVETLANLGVLASERGNLSLSMSFYEHALRLEPDNPAVKWNLSLVLLSTGNFDKGWQLYDQGKLAQTRSKQISPAVENKNEFSIEYFKNKSVYIRGEQGLGDEVMFASCIPDIIAVAKKCTVECDNRLLPLFQRSFPDTIVLTEYDSIVGLPNVNKTSADIIISSASLPRFIRRGFTEFPVRKSYLNAYKEAIQHWQKRYATSDKKLNIGISWRGGINDETRRRSAGLENWLSLLQTPGCQFINLQYGDVSKEQAYIDKYMREWPDTNHFHNIEQLAAQISALDLVITVSNVTAHLAGALGVPAFVLLPHSPNWRWFMGKNPSPWYSSVTLFTQDQPDEWQSVFQKVERALQVKYLDKTADLVSHDEH